MNDRSQHSPDDLRENFAALYSQHHLALLRYTMTLLPDRTQAEDVVQETARALWKKADEYDPAHPFWPWAKKFAYFEVMRHRKKFAVRGKYFSGELVETLADERELHEPELDEKRAILDTCVRKLDDRAADLISRRYGNGQSLDEIAKAEGKSANSLYILMHRIRKKLIDCVNRTMHSPGWEGSTDFAR